MRLIDADKLSQKSCSFGIRKNCQGCSYTRMISTIPCYEIRLDFLRMIDKEKTAKAIPIDYIEKWIDARARIIKINPPAFRELLATKLLDDWLAGREPDWHIKFEVEENERV